MSTHERLKIEDGTSWPDPRFVGDATWKLIHRPEQLSDYERLILAACVEAYGQLLGHPWGTEASIRKVRMLRRAIKLDERDEEPDDE